MTLQLTDLYVTRSTHTNKNKYTHYDFNLQCCMRTRLWFNHLPRKKSDIPVADICYVFLSLERLNTVCHYNRLMVICNKAKFFYSFLQKFFK